MKYIMLEPLSAFWDAMGQKSCCVAMRMEGNIIHCLSGTGAKYRFFKDEFEPNNTVAPDFDRPSITDYGQTLVFGKYQAAFRPEPGRLVCFNDDDA